MNSKSQGPPEPDENLMAGQRPLPWEPEIEHSLKRLVLRSPSAELDAKVWCELRRPRAGSRLRTTFLSIAAAVAVASGSVPLLVHYLGPGTV